MKELSGLDGIKVAGRNVNSIRYADDMVLLEDTEEQLRRTMDELNDQCRIKGLKINKSGTKVIGGTKRRERLAVSINIKSVAIKQIGNFMDLGS